MSAERRLVGERGPEILRPPTDRRETLTDRCPDCGELYVVVDRMTWTPSAFAPGVLYGAIVGTDLECGCT